MPTAAYSRGRQARSGRDRRARDRVASWRHRGPARSEQSGTRQAEGVTESSRVALLLVDVINDLSFPGSSALVRQAIPMARRLAALKARSRRAKIPAIYINDNFGKWRSDFRW